MCKDDEFVYRGANPRTGIVSPFIFGEGSGNVWQDLEIPTEKTGWIRVEDSLECSQVANTPMIRITQSSDGEPSCMKSSKGLQHTEAFSHVNLNSTSTRDEKTQEYQGNLANVYQSKTQNTAGMRTSNASVIPPTTKLQHIRRKKIGSGPIQKDGSTITKKCENSQDSSKKISINDISAFEASPVSSVEAGAAPFTALADHLNGNLENPATFQDTFIASAASKKNSAISGKYIACLHFLQPPHSTSLTTSYRRAPQVSAIQPRSTDSRDNRQKIGSASTNDTSCTTCKSEQRPQVYRKFATASIPTVDFHKSESENEGQYFLSLAAKGDASITNQSMRVDKIDPNLQNHFNSQRCDMLKLARGKANIPSVGSVSKANVIFYYAVSGINSVFSAQIANAQISRLNICSSL